MRAKDDWAAVQLLHKIGTGTGAMQRGNMCNRHLHCNLKYRCAAQQRTMVNVQHATCDNSTQHATIVLWHAVACLDLCHLNGKAALDSAIVLEHCTRRGPGPASHSSHARTHIDTRSLTRSHACTHAHSTHRWLCTAGRPLGTSRCAYAYVSAHNAHYLSPISAASRTFGVGCCLRLWLGLAVSAWQFRPRRLQLQFQFQGRAHRR